MKTSELSGRALDYYVAKAEGLPLSSEWDCAAEGIFIGHGDGDLREYSPSTSWCDGGPIIERECIGIMKSGIEWKAWAVLDMDASSIAESPLVAAMRAYVASKFGDEVLFVSPREMPDD